MSMARSISVAALILLVCTAASALAPPEGDKKSALVEFEKGNERFVAGDFAAAATRFEAAYQAYPDPAYLYNIGVCYERLERWGQAARRFGAFLDAVPEDHPARKKVGAKLQAARAAYKASQVTIQLRTRPEGLSARVISSAGEATCVTPCEVRTDPGAITVVFQRGSVRRTHTKSVQRGQTWDVPLEDLTGVVKGDPTGQLVVNVDVPGASVFVGERTVPAGSKVEMPVGTHNVTVVHKDYRSFLQAVEVVEDHVVQLNVRMDPRSAGQGQRIVGWTTLGVGGALLVNAVVFAALASADYSDAESIAGSGPYNPEREAQFRDLVERTERKSLVADVCFGLGGAAVATGLILWLTADSGSGQGRLAVDGPELGLGGHRYWGQF